MSDFRAVAERIVDMDVDVLSREELIRRIEIILEEEFGHPARRFRAPTVDEVAAYCKDRGNRVDPEAFVNFYSSKGWVVGKSPMKDWRAAVRTWEKNGRQSDKAAQRQDPLEGVDWDKVNQIANR